MPDAKPNLSFEAVTHDLPEEARRVAFHLRVYRYVLPTMVPCWCLDENQRDMVAEAFAMGSFMAIATRDMTGKLSDAPELAAQVARLAKLRKATAAWVAHGQFMDDRGLRVRGATGYVYASRRGLAVTLANGRSRPATAKVTLTPAELGRAAGGTCTLYVEGARPQCVPPQRRGESLAFGVKLPSYAAAVLTVAPGRS